MASVVDSLWRFGDTRGPRPLQRLVIPTFVAWRPHERRIRAERAIDSHLRLITDPDPSDRVTARRRFVRLTAHKTRVPIGLEYRSNSLTIRHLRRILQMYFVYYHQSRGHLSLDRNSPVPREVESPACGKVVSISQVGGLSLRLGSVGPTPFEDRGAILDAVDALDNVLLGHHGRLLRINHDGNAWPRL